MSLSDILEIFRSGDTRVSRDQRRTNTTIISNQQFTRYPYHCCRSVNDSLGIQIFEWFWDWNRRSRLCLDHFGRCCGGPNSLSPRSWCRQGCCKTSCCYLLIGCCCNRSCRCSSTFLGCRLFWFFSLLTILLSLLSIVQSLRFSLL